MRTWLHDSSKTYPEQEIDVLARADVTVSSEAPDHPVSHIFDAHRGPGGTQWVATESGDQHLGHRVSSACHHPTDYGEN